MKNRLPLSASGDVDLAQLKVCIIAGALGQGGAERQMFYIAQALQNSGCKVRFLSLTRGEIWEGRIKDLGVTVTWVGQNAGRGARLRRIIEELRRDKPHILQSGHFFTNIYAALAGRLLGLRDIGAIRSNALSEATAHGRSAGVLCMRLPRLLAANSRVGMRNAVQLGVPEKRLRFLPNVLDTEHFRPPDSQPDGPFHLVAVGRLGPEKRFDRFLRVVARLREASPAVRATLVGDGSQRESLQSLARELQIEDIFSFTGAVADPRPYFQSAHIAFLCSTYEGTPNVLLEAQACGLPVVSTNVGGVADALQDGKTGILVMPETEEATVEQLYQAVQTLHDDEMRRRAMSHQARNFIEENYSVARLPKFLAELYA